MPGMCLRSSHQIRLIIRTGNFRIRGQLSSWLCLRVQGLEHGLNF